MRPEGHRHNTIPVADGDLVVNIDENLARTIELCWYLKIETTLSCESGCPTDGHCWIMFPAESAESFSRALVPSHPPARINRDLDDVYWKLMRAIQGSKPELGSREWYMSAAWDADDDSLQIHIRFPFGDIDAIERRLSDELHDRLALEESCSDES